jgi:ribose 5-phosphate isomerase A
MVYFYKTDFLMSTVLAQANKRRSQGARTVFQTNTWWQKGNGMDRREEQKRMAAFRAVGYLTSGMVVGLGTGSTAKFALERIAAQIREGALKNLLGIPSSRQTEKLALASSIPLTTLDEHPEIDLTIDGADEVDMDLNLIKGGGGALLREKVLAQASHRMIVIVDESKRSKRLGSRWPLPIEVLPFARQVEENYLKSLGATIKLRRSPDGGPFVTDEGNFILDADFGPMENPEALSRMLNLRAGIVEHGLFIGLASEVIVSGKGGIEHLRRNR